ncbi:MAG: hypothetical protein EA424_24055 [Planctomycetaceae bacterium]|nr:MAG: hypothetical protein EA424_24055 [Planctomycetaceae bacterium]
MGQRTPPQKLVYTIMAFNSTVMAKFLRKIPVFFDGDDHATPTHCTDLQAAVYICSRGTLATVFRRFRVSQVMHTVQCEHDADLAPEYLHQQ